MGFMIRQRYTYTHIQYNVIIVVAFVCNILWIHLNAYSIDVTKVVFLSERISNLMLISSRLVICLMCDVREKICWLLLTGLLEGEATVDSKNTKSNIIQHAVASNLD